jgi:hypothetical protein
MNQRSRFEQVKEEFVEHMNAQHKTLFYERRRKEIGLEKQK